LVGYGSLTYTSSLLKLTNPTSTSTIRVEDSGNANIYSNITPTAFNLSRSTDGSAGTSGSFYRVGDQVAGISARSSVLLMSDTRGFLQVGQNGVSIERAASLNTQLTAPSTSSVFDVLSTAQGSRPFPIMSAAQANAITGVQGLFTYENTVGPRWYNGTRKAYALESTFARGTATRVPFFDANGQVTDNADFTVTGMGTATVRAVLNSSDNVGFSLNNAGANKWMISSYLFNAGNYDFSFYNAQTSRASMVIDGDTDNLITNRGVQIGTTLSVGTTATVASTLTVSGDIIANNSSQANVILAKGGNDFAHAAYQQDSGNDDYTIYAYARNAYGLFLSGDADKAGIYTRTPDYNLDVNGVLGIDIPRGTVAQRPTIASSTTPFRYNTDSTALEYGESVGTWWQLATRAYARTLVPTTLYPGDGSIPTNTNRTVNYDTGGDNYFKLINSSTQKGIQAEFAHDPFSAFSPYSQFNNYYTYYNNAFYGTQFEVEGQIDHGLSASATVVTRLERIGSKKTGSSRVGVELGSGRKFAFYVNSVDSLGTEYHQNGISGSFDSLANDSASKSFYFGGFAYRNQTSQWQNKSIAATKSWLVQQNYGTGSTKFDWLRVDNLDTDTTSNRLSFYNNKYVLPNTRPASGSGLKQSIVWTAGTPAFEYVKKDTTIYVTDADYNFSAAITSANILLKFNRIIIYSKLSSGSTSDNQIFLHTPSSDFLQCEIIIYSNDASADSDATSIDFTTNGAVDGAGGTVSSYPMSAGQRVNIRVVDDGGYKWFFN